MDYVSSRVRALNRKWEALGVVTLPIGLLLLMTGRRSEGAK